MPPLKIANPTDQTAERIRRRGPLLFTGKPEFVAYDSRRRRLKLPADMVNPAWPRLLCVATLVDTAGDCVCDDLEGVGYTEDYALAEMEQHCQFRLSGELQKAALAIIRRARKDFREAGK